ncbi:MAG: hypothetical protein JSR60_19925 [Proteobacteria bacterium]|nr:hypothetical protein [Pseudomonadota bacterium]
MHLAHKPPLQRSPEIRAPQAAGRAGPLTQLAGNLNAAPRSRALGTIQRQLNPVVQRAVTVEGKSYSMQDGTLGDLVDKVALMTMTEDRRRPDQLLTRYDFQNRRFANFAALVRTVNAELKDVAFDEEIAKPPLASGGGGHALNLALGQLEQGGETGMTGLVHETNKRLMEGEGKETKAVPKILSHFWSGGKLSPEAFKNLKKWSVKANQGGWFQYIFTDPQINKVLGKDDSLDLQLNVLRQLGAVIVHLDQLPIARKPAYDMLKRQIVESGKPSGLSFMSDLVRYEQLLATGGVYADVDVGPGSVDLNTALDVTGNIPQLGPMFRTSKEAREESALDKDGRLKESSMLGKFAHPNMAIGTHLIATQPNNPVIREAYDLASKDLLDAGATNGPAQILRAFKKLGLNLRDSVAGTVPQWLPKLDWLTPESDNLVD